MIHVIDASNAPRYEAQLQEHFFIRHRIYVGERKWQALERPDGREIDQFDNEDAIYLLALEGSRVVGGTRLVPTLRPHLMSEVFPYLANVRGLQRGPDIVEWTRIFAIPERRGASHTVLHSVLAGMLEYCLQNEITAITVVMETWWMPRFLELGWDVVPLGLPAMIDDMSCVGAMIRVTEAAWRNTLAFKGLTAPVLHQAASTVPQGQRGILHG